ncbi:helix-turn-helix transcriptional regulator [Enterococcus cecorum]|uniref:helix-turn-helix domain-containing protein n=1 Tax=Enterococcus cecorum TaxID=44008 RepID=UPI001FABC492|nr:helix-turn-helix transcriptional regulator [Enterococcus cecorum]MCJ0572142.1 helix-turn-helix transcriptional regulator [Enterococcus cecorum]MCJ0590472.1 helix-turn-helix transcriptional regulator [Enterococcus cecorum]MDZ5577779.1 helix-turn-helix transcriptional regulator [Enterococcus cecorum]
MWEKIELELRKREMTIYQLTKLTGVSMSVMYEFRRGNIKKPSFELIEKIADALNVSMDIFRKDDEDDGINKN